jgi:hypothetical protein
MDQAIYYVYQYVDEFGQPYYIGKGKNNRIHVQHTHTTLPLIERRIIVADALTNEEAKLLEGQLISKFGRKIDGGILDNIKINQWACFDGWTHSDRAKRKISEKNKGKVRSDQARMNYKKPKSAEHIEKIRQANVGRKDSSERRLKNSQGQNNPDVKLIKSEKMKQLIAERKALGIGWGRSKKGKE